jgi:lysophospholipase L1-like esterase
VAVLPEDDLLGLVGQHPEQKDVKRWIAGLGHELGHAFGLAHPRDTEKDGDALMWAGIYGKYPDKTYLTNEDKGILRKSPFFFLPHAEEDTGLAALTGKDTPLKPGTTIAFFGDSITMQGGYIETIQKALTTSPQTKDLKVKLLQHGLNGGRVPTVLEGQSPWGKLGGTMQQLLDKEKPDVVVIFLGVNDVWHKEKGTTPEDFRAGLRKMIDLSRAGGAKVVLVTLATIGEKPDGSNPFDKKLDQYAQLTCDLARQTHVTLVDLRKEFLAYLRQHNTKDANGQYKADKILTYDGVHMLPAGNDLLADRISRGIAATLKK